MDDLEEGMHARLTLTGEIGIHLPAGAGTLLLTRVEMTSRGTFSAPVAPLRLTLEGAHEELRKLRGLSPSIDRVLDMQPDAEGEGTLMLVAPEDHLAALGAAARGADDLDAQAMLQNVAWMTLLFTLDKYEARSIGTITRSTG